MNPGNSWDQDEMASSPSTWSTGAFTTSWLRNSFTPPRVSHIKLDEYGSFLWKEIDGKRTVGDLALRMKAQFGAGAEPLYDRLVKYMQILRNNQFILFQGKDKVAP